jgi:SNF2 family DNA or RNA helicase
MSCEDFEFLQRLGSGSFGTVFRVRRLVDDQIYVVKVVRIAELTLKEKGEAINEVRLLAQIDNDVVTAATAGVALNKCRQVASGGVYLSDDVVGLLKPAHSERKWAALHDAKTDALGELIEELQGQQVLITYEFRHDLARLQKRFGADIAVIGGGTTERTAKKIISDWNNGVLTTLFGHPASMGHGLNLQHSGCYQVCHYTLTWDFELYDQVIKRVLRQGNASKRVFNHIIVARGTVDEVVLGSLRHKNKTQQALFDALKQLRKDEPCA